MNFSTVISRSSRSCSSPTAQSPIAAVPPDDLFSHYNYPYKPLYLRNEQGIMVTSASSTAENSQAAMMIAVSTKPGYQRKGYATLCMEKLCSELLSEGTSLCLFYNNPTAGKIYK